MYLKSKGRKETYINSILKGIRSFFNYCVEEGYIHSKLNPSINVRWLKEDRTIIKTFNDDEIKAMVNSFKMTDYIEARNKLIMLVLVDTGIRNLELCTLTMENILETTMVIDGKGNKQRYLYLSPMLKKYMIRYDRIRTHYFKKTYAIILKARKKRIISYLQQFNKDVIEAFENNPETFISSNEAVFHVERKGYVFDKAKEKEEVFLSPRKNEPKRVREAREELGGKKKPSYKPIMEDFTFDEDYYRLYFEGLYAKKIKELQEHYNFRTYCENPS